MQQDEKRGWQRPNHSIKEQMTDHFGGREIHITGVVQGVGFRPFVYGLAQRYGLAGWVRNSSAGVDIVVDGRLPALDAFTDALQREVPPLARINSLEISNRPANGFAQFEIRHSQPVDGAFQPIAPDVTVCPDCLRELFDPTDRRYRYPFLNCTHCGPRFTIIRDIPYDRSQTTMASFPMCPTCAAEYENPLDRRFHAQPVACPLCGPRVWLVMGDVAAQPPGVQLSVIAGKRERAGLALSLDDPVQMTRQLLADGKIVAIKGLGGFHLACDAANETAVAELRRRKLRLDKPFAVMVADAATAVAHTHLNDAERELLTSRERPIVLLRRKAASTIATAVAPGQNQLGLMLPYTPLHYLLLAPEAGFPAALVMTSGNRSEEPIAYTNEEALAQLSDLADAFLLHNRDIHMRCDDSVMCVVNLATEGIVNSEDAESPPGPHLRHFPSPIRRARGYAPSPVRLPWKARPSLATGAELKNSFCLSRDRYAFLSQHIGDLENYETLCAFEEGITHFERMFRVRPEIIAYDLHPDYLATRYALERAEREGITAVGVQHHHAHIAACMAEHGLRGERPVIGVALDGTGYGGDGAMWGGEFLVADYAGYTRPYHLHAVLLPGGDTAVRQPWRTALAWLKQAGISWDEDVPPVHYAVSSHPLTVDVLQRQLQTGLNAPRTSSMGRLFDAVAALTGVRQVVNYEGQAAIELEALVDETETAAYPFSLEKGVVDPAPMLAAIVDDLRGRVQTAVIAARFHNTVVHMVMIVCGRMRAETGLKEVALSGGVWQNRTLLQRTIPSLQQKGFTVYWHQTVPANDGGLALGQAVIAANSG